MNEQRLEFAVGVAELLADARAKIASQEEELRSLREERYRLMVALEATKASAHTRIKRAQESRRNFRQFRKKQVARLEADVASLKAQLAQTIAPANPDGVCGDAYIPSVMGGECKCMDCGLPYTQFPMDTIVDNEQWAQLVAPLHRESGILCVGCIVKRGRARFTDATAFLGRFELASDFGEAGPRSLAEGLRAQLAEAKSELDETTREFLHQNTFCAEQTLRAESAEAELKRLREGMARTAAELRDAYRQLAAGEVVNQRKFATGLLGPQVERLERLVAPVEEGKVMTTESLHERPVK